MNYVEESYVDSHIKNGMDYKNSLAEDVEFIFHKIVGIMQFYLVHHLTRSRIRCFFIFVLVPYLYFIKIEYNLSK